jgi:hypothetical protein
MASTPPHDLPKAPSPMRLSDDHMARLYKLTLEVSRALHREVTPTAILRLIIGYGLTMAEGQRDFARKVRDGVSPPWRLRRTKRVRRPVSEARAISPQKKGKSRDLDRRGQ